jgi:hypothetical protein
MKYLIVIIALLAGCTTQWIRPDTHEAQLQEEAGRLAELVRSKKITKTQAADRLNIKRIEVVGANPFDDEVFAYYRKLAEQRDQGKIAQAEAQSRMVKKLADVRTRYRQRTEGGKPAPEPVFTRFMLRLYGQPPL